MFEIAISHIQNVRAQEKLKTVRYSKNSSIHVTHTNYDTVPKSHNVCEIIGKMHKSLVKLCVLRFRAFRKILKTEAFEESMKELENIGIRGQSLKKLIEKYSFSVWAASSNLIV